MLDGKLESVLDYIKANQPKEGHPDLDGILYIHVKQMSYDQTTDILCTTVRDDLVDVTNFSVRNGVVDISLTKKDRSIGVMVIDTKLQVKHVQINYLINYICISPTF